MGRRLNTYVTVGGTTYPPGEVSDEVADSIENEKVFEVDPAAGYSSMKLDDLKAAIATRNEGREDADLIPIVGKKADLVAALEADDEK